jgi:hypothetical protein
VGEVERGEHGYQRSSPLGGRGAARQHVTELASYAGLVGAVDGRPSRPRDQPEHTVLARLDDAALPEPVQQLVAPLFAQPADEVVSRALLLSDQCQRLGEQRV